MQKRGKNSNNAPALSLVEQFDRLCPVYMAMGMSYSEYWDGDPWAVKAYRMAYEYRREMENESFYLQGMYTVCAVANAIHGKKAKYPDKPFILDTAIGRERKRQEQELNELKVVDYMNTFAEQFNQRFFAKQAAKKEEEEQQKEKQKAEIENAEKAIQEARDAMEQLNNSVESPFKRITEDLEKKG